MDTPVNFDDYEDDDVRSPITLARVILTNKIMEHLIEELGERLFAVRKIVHSALDETKKDDVHRGVYEAILRLLDQKISTNLWKIGEDIDDE
jgi:hypothetical protein